MKNKKKHDKPKPNSPKDAGELDSEGYDSRPFDNVIIDVQIQTLQEVIELCEKRIAKLEAGRYRAANGNKKDLSGWLTKQQAADIIGVSTKTIEQFTQQGKLQSAKWVVGQFEFSKG